MYLCMGVLILGCNVQLLDYIERVLNCLGCIVVWLVLVCEIGLDGNHVFTITVVHLLMYEHCASENVIVP